MTKSVSKKFMAVSVAVLMTVLLAGCGADSSTGAGGTATNSLSNSVSAGKAASLSWNAPATRVNGEGLAMGELQGYVILYGRESDDLTQRVEITSASTMDHTISNLEHGEWFFAIQVIDVNGLVSAPSEVVSKTI